jgi:hypothetical protein
MAVRDNMERAFTDSIDDARRATGRIVIIMLGFFKRVIERTHLVTSLWDIGSVLIANWPTIVSVVVAAAAAFWGWRDWATQYGYLPVVGVSLIFLGASAQTQSEDSPGRQQFRRLQPSRSRRCVPFD